MSVSSPTVKMGGGTDGKDEVPALEECVATENDGNLTREDFPPGQRAVDLEFVRDPGKKEFAQRLDGEAPGSGNG